MIILVSLTITNAICKNVIDQYILAMQYHHRSAKDISEPENSPMRVLSNETLLTFMNRVNTDVPHPEIIS